MKSEYKWEDRCTLCGKILSGRGTKDWYTLEEIQKVKVVDASFIKNHLHVPVCRSMKKCLEPEKNGLLRDFAGRPDYSDISRHIQRRSYLYKCVWCKYEWSTAMQKKPQKCRSCGSIYWDNPDPPKSKCLQCGNEWVNHKGTSVCGSCGSIYWDNPDPPKSKCLQCGNEWVNHKGTEIIRCPSCESIYWNNLYPPPVYTCLQCGHKWIPTSLGYIKRCPKCKSERWMAPTRELTCLQCNHHWITRSRLIPLYCPNCKSSHWDEPITSKIV